MQLKLLCTHTHPHTLRHARLTHPTKTLGGEGINIPAEILKLYTGSGGGPNLILLLERGEVGDGDLLAICPDNVVIVKLFTDSILVLELWLNALTCSRVCTIDEDDDDDG